MLSSGLPLCTTIFNTFVVKSNIQFLLQFYKIIGRKKFNSPFRENLDPVYKSRQSALLEEKKGKGKKFGRLKKFFVARPVFLTKAKSVLMFLDTRNCQKVGKFLLKAPMGGAWAVCCAQSWTLAVFFGFLNRKYLFL